ncbi:MAG: Rieske 2Fe-2S domain-containing protein [Acidobacteria bacterium]|nr:Rieske 2Fe-2S domain-containing protein [Acidobacteriota bacterium]NIQ83509.1 Rieske 2Fe-2S domain-containing protein [Acidobacteriota bacterium]
MEGFFDAGPMDSFPRGRGRVVLVEGVRVAVFNLDHGWYALKDACPHMGSSLAEGRLRGHRVTCRWHAWSFDLATGESDSKRKACARVYELRAEEGRIWLKPPPPPGQPPQEEDDDWMSADPETWFR